MRASEENPLVLSEPWPRALSVGMIAIGVGVIVLTFSDLHRALWPVNLLTPLFAVMVGGACLVGFTLAAGGLQPRAKRWCFHDDRKT